MEQPALSSFSPSDLESIRKGQRQMILSLVAMALMIVVSIAAIMLVAIGDGAGSQDPVENFPSDFRIFFIVVLVLANLVVHLALGIVHVMGMLRILLGMKASPAVTTLCLLVWLPMFYYSFQASRILKQHSCRVGLLGARRVDS
jgi:succinate dehydrogenase hydrophobic anchor subunit